MSKNDKTKILNFGQAERNARKRDLEIEKENFKQDHNGISEEEVNKAMEVLTRSTGKDIFIGTKRSPNSKIKFAQALQENLHFLYENKYLTDGEKTFLMSIMPYIAFSSNCIVLDIKVKNPTPANITEIGQLVGKTRQSVSPTINSLKRKGLIAKSESGVEGNNVKAYAIFINPHIIYAGDKDNVNESLKTMFYKSMKMPMLKDLPSKLF